MMETEVKLEVGYRAIVEKHITDDAGNIPRGSLRKLASKLKCDPAFLSHYLKEKCDFSADHAYRFAKAYDFRPRNEGVRRACDVKRWRIFGQNHS